MKAFLIDAENINLKLFSEITRFGKKDKFYIVGNENLKLTCKIPNFIGKKRCKFYTFNKSSKDYADKIILTLVGYLCSKKKIDKIYIASNDKIFSKIDYIQEIFNKKVQILRFSNVECKEDKKDIPKITHISKPLIEDKTQLKLKEFFEKNLNEIKEIQKNSTNKADFHNNLSKKFGQNGIKLYKYIKENASEILGDI
ncbi:FxsA family membrane protein [Campylobacter blaseri]|uniref:PIN-like domain-containing protein n=1 Tax=Campylobacter blaseri TaxID=2042961 RepID=A0A2P8QZF0_9BACT|nr:hypothetical protein [Campylobacter blaseri]PSM51625.1 hypothetical protein CQ405_07470 [Campylobacter blaseri]PSM53418.1 hypothetical protein CRN67_07475 [Campylobacter blaseri]QKF86714.1 FxsA family membrane protein [Campylobacter blaseri]